MQMLEVVNLEQAVNVDVILALSPTEHLNAFAL